MTTFEEQVLALNAQKSSLQSDLERAQNTARVAAHELTASKVNAKRVQERVSALQSCFDFMRGEAEIVSFGEFGQVSKFLRENKALLATYNAHGEEATIKGKAAAERVQQILKQLDEVDEELGSHGKIIPFPRFQEVPHDDA